MRIPYNRIKLRPKKDRIRFQSGKDVSKLKESLLKIGQLHDLILDGNDVLRAGERRYIAIGQLKKEHPEDERWQKPKVDIRAGLTDLEYFDIELDENWRRMDLTPYEKTVALTKRKKMYDVEHPEATIKGSHLKQQRTSNGKFSISKTTVELSAKTAGSKKNVLKTRKDAPEAKIAPAERFTKNTARELNVSERSVQQYVQIGKAIEEKKFDEDTVKKFKEGKIAFTQMRKKTHEISQATKKKAKERSALARVATLKAIEAEKNTVPAIVLKDTDEVASVAVIPSVQIKSPNWCKDCKHGQRQTCPDCFKEVVACNQAGYVILKSTNAEACKKYEE